MLGHRKTGHNTIHLIYPLRLKEKTKEKTKEKKKRQNQPFAVGRNSGIIKQ